MPLIFDVSSGNPARQTHTSELSLHLMGYLDGLDCILV